MSQVKGQNEKCDYFYKPTCNTSMFSWFDLTLHPLQVTHQPTLNSTWASNRATIGAVAALHPLTLDRISPSCLVCRTILINPGRWLLVSDTKSCSFSFNSSTKHKHTWSCNPTHFERVFSDLTGLGEKTDTFEKTSTHNAPSCPSSVGRISIVGGQMHSCFSALISGPKTQQLEPAQQTSMELTGHNGILQYWGLSQHCFQNREGGDGGGPSIL